MHPNEIAAPWWVTRHPSVLHCTLLSYAAPLSYEVLKYPALHPTELHCIFLTYAAPSELHCTLHPNELYHILLSYTAPFWTTLNIWSNAPYRATSHSTVLCCTSLSYAAPTELLSTLLPALQLICSLLLPPSSPCLGVQLRFNPYGLAHPNWARCTLLSYAVP